ncbi:branched-chain alpha-keto acid dehydrogenase subunit E2 [Leifsonia xyli subsp. cynodontis DSM 46306]|uniref:Dihydrolipoamide acetyltransferase component of pyruvate dehydrogenase complex n=1 Tax=Leifsonia xyli subsp. cynodontis DSM 46306 TaxID=1389489 RepID=U3PD06_LEIXC|nr:dihydrolipoamide acetyltransferase family protein [Leifsonia xyli]AGW42662.1 branched-chain alpha-keto acid dehydrogenase subunit E2 [Leifsonia xyli subsp. cynodontis DSM 46306]
MRESQFLLPDVGEGLTEAEIVSWKVAPGDAVAVNQVIVEIETAKSLVELPSPFEGTVGELLVAEGQTVEVGTPIFTVSGGEAERGEPEPAGEAEQAVVDAAASVTHESQEPKAGAVLVGYGSAGHGTSRRRVTHPGAAARPAAFPPAEPVAELGLAPSTPVPPPGGGPVIAKPPIRKLAKDLGVDLSTVTATGAIGEVTRDDVLREATQASVFRNIQTPEWPDDREERIPVKGVRKAIANAMVTSAFSAPHVSVFVDVDATRTMEFVKRLKNAPDFVGVKVSPLLIMAKAIVWAVRRNPTVNSTWTDEEIIVRHYVNLGIAAATPRGLIVPNVKEAQGMSLFELARALEELTLTAREGKTQPADMANGTITITNIGVFGMDTGTPILNPGEVGIVALGTIKQKPWVVDGEVRPRFVTTLGGSFDHRVVDGDVASRFLADVASIIEEPALLLD